MLVDIAYKDALISYVKSECFHSINYRKLASCLA
jgi:hypothetical protein